MVNFNKNILKRYFVIGDNRIDNKEFLGVIKNRSFYGAPEVN